MRIIAQDPAVKSAAELSLRRFKCLRRAGPWTMGNRVQVLDFDASTQTLIAPQYARAQTAGR